jgi:hypothetical protein
MVIAFLLAAAIAQPSSESLQLGKELAKHGTLAALLPMIKAKEVGELVADHPSLNAVDQEKLRATADQVFEGGRDRILTAEGASYAQAMSIDDLKAALAFYRSPAGARFEAALPKVIAGTAMNMGKVDFKGDVLAAYCKQTGKLCLGK